VLFWFGKTITLGAITTLLHLRTLDT
jgi:hypothetical protein